MVAVAAIPTDAKNPLQSCSVIALTAFPMALMRVRFVRAAVVRSSALSFDHIFPIGLRSGEYGSRKNSLAPGDSIDSATAMDLWLDRLSITTMSPGLSFGTSSQSI